MAEQCPDYGWKVVSEDSVPEFESKVFYVEPSWDYEPKDQIISYKTNDLSVLHLKKKGPPARLILTSKAKKSGIWTHGQPTLIYLSVGESISLLEYRNENERLTIDIEIPELDQESNLLIKKPVRLDDLNPPTLAELVKPWSNITIEKTEEYLKNHKGIFVKFEGPEPNCIEIKPKSHVPQNRDFWFSWKNELKVLTGSNNRNKPKKDIFNFGNFDEDVIHLIYDLGKHDMGYIGKSLLFLSLRDIDEEILPQAQGRKWDKTVIQITQNQHLYIFLLDLVIPELGLSDTRSLPVSWPHNGINESRIIRTPNYIEEDDDGNRIESKRRSPSDKSKWDLEIKGKDWGVSSDINDWESLSLVEGKKEDEIQLWTHQKEGLENWKENDFLGILEHATGSGKTITALTAIKNHVEKGLPVLVLAPSQLLVDQWSKEIEKNLTDIDLLKADSRFKKDWLNDIGLYLENFSSNRRRVTVCSIQTARTENFLSRIGDLNSTLVIVDECHRIGGLSYSEICKWRPAKILGLSATPEVYGDPEGTKRVKSLCGDVIHRFTLTEAISQGYLTPYIYNIEKVSLTNEHEFCDDKKCRKCELSTYQKQMLNIHVNMMKYKRKHGKSSLSWKEFPHWIRNDIINTKKIIKKASRKIDTCRKVILDNYDKQNKQHWLIFCEDSKQLEDIHDSLGKSGVAPIYAYWSRAEGADLGNQKKREKFAPKETIENWKRTGGIMISIHCLDEGIDFPWITHGIILASSKNPRQFIQRRGRMLRTYEDKNYARIWDLLVVPSSNAKSEYTNYVFNEINRASAFAKDAKINNAEAKLTNIRHDLGLSDLFASGSLDDGSMEEEIGD